MSLDLIIAGVGLVSQAFGAFSSRKEGKKAAKYAKQQEQLQAAVSAENRKIEGYRKEQANFDRIRAERNIIRQTQIARATAVSNAANSGASFSSGLQGGLGQIAGEGSAALTSLNENFQLGQKVFDANARIAAYGGQINTLQSRINQSQANQDFGRTLFSFGSQLFQGAPQISQTLQSAGGLFK